MLYVMVPVPEEHVQEAMQAVLRISARASVTEWDVESVAEFFEAMDEATKAVVSCVARATLTRGPVPDVDVARTVEISQREVLGIVRELNEQASQAGRPSMVNVQTMTETLPTGRTREQRVLTMPRPTAELIRAAEQAEGANIPHPLTEGPG